MQMPGGQEWKERDLQEMATPEARPYYYRPPCRQEHVNKTVVLCLLWGLSLAAAGRCRSGQDRYPTRYLRLSALWGEGCLGKRLVCFAFGVVRASTSMCDVVSRREKIQEATWPRSMAQLDQGKGNNVCCVGNKCAYSAKQLSKEFQQRKVLQRPGI